MDTLDKLIAINRAYDEAYRGNEPFRIVSRLAEECGELAQQVNHFENAGQKREKHGEPDRMALAQEIQDVIRCALQVAAYYGAQNELELSVSQTYEKLKERG